MKMSKSVEEKASKLSSDLYERQFTFFLGAGFSRNIKNMPDFKSLVKGRILPEFIEELVTLGTGDDLLNFFSIREFRPKNCLHCFIKSYIEINPDGCKNIKSDWMQAIQTAQLHQGTGFFQDLTSCIQHFQSKDITQDQLLLKILDEILVEKNVDSNLILLREKVSDVYGANLADCISCKNAYWKESHQKETRLILGLLQSYLEGGDYQITNLLEYIQNSTPFSKGARGGSGDKTDKDKYTIAKYAFENNLEFKSFADIIDEYHRNPQATIGDQQIVLARLAKEGLLHQIITTNWDDLMELACYAVDMYVKTTDDKVFGQPGEKLDLQDIKNSMEFKPYVNHAVAISERENFYDSKNQLAPTKKTFFIYKIHGGIDKILDAIKSKEASDASFPNFIITQRDLADWRNDNWSEDLVNSILRSHDIIFAGISGRDNVIYATVRKIIEELEEIMQKVSRQDIKRIFAINIEKELILDSMIRGSDKNEQIITVNPKDLARFYRQFYSLLILRTFHTDRASHLRKIAELMDDTYSYDLIENLSRIVDEFIDQILVDGTKNEEIAKILDIFYYSIPKFMQYTWLINNNLRGIEADLGIGNLLLKKPHYYLPIFSNTKWFTFYVIIMAKLFEFLKTNELLQDVVVIEDGFFIIDGVALLIVIQGKEELCWDNLQIGTVQFATESLVYLSSCRKKVILSIAPHEQDSDDEQYKFVLNHEFEFCSLGIDQFDQRMSQILNYTEVSL